MKKQELPEPKKSKELVIGEGELHWSKATDHQGNNVVVVGEVVRTNNIGPVTFLNFNEDFRSSISIVVLQESYGNFKTPAETLYDKKTIRVRGKVTEHRGNPQIVITSPDQVDIIE